jgi:hypothetical protein
MAVKLPHTRGMKLRDMIHNSGLLFFTTTATTTTTTNNNNNNLNLNFMLCIHFRKTRQ